MGPGEKALREDIAAMRGALRARRHLQVETPEGALLTVGEVAAFVDRCREIGIPDTATLASPGSDPLRRLPISFAVTWTEDL